MEALLVEFQGIGIEEFIVLKKIQDQILHFEHTIIRFDIKSMNVHLIKKM
jgi:hypothetical protein